MCVCVCVCVYVCLCSLCECVRACRLGEDIEISSKSLKCTCTVKCSEVKISYGTEGKVEKSLKVDVR